MKEVIPMKMTKQWNRRLFAVALGTVLVGAPLFAVHAEGPTFSREGQQYDVRRGMYEKEGGSDEHVRLGRYADEAHRQAREEERREDQEKRQAEERCEEEAKAEARHEAHKEGNEPQQHEKREYRYDVRRGMYEQEGGSDTEVRRGMYEQPSEDGERRSLTR